jgi:hypothetical protein
MAAIKGPISLDPLTASGGAPGRITWAFVQTGCTRRLRLKRHNRRFLYMHPERTGPKVCRLAAHDGRAGAFIDHY